MKATKRLPYDRDEVQKGRPFGSWSVPGIQMRMTEKTTRMSNECLELASPIAVIQNQRLCRMRMRTNSGSSPLANGFDCVRLSARYLSLLLCIVVLLALCCKAIIRIKAALAVIVHVQSAVGHLYQPHPFHANKVRINGIPATLTTA